MIITEEDVLKVLTVWMVFKLESTIIIIIIVCFKMDIYLIAGRCLAGGNRIATIFANYWWCIGATIIDVQRIVTKINYDCYISSGTQWETFCWHLVTNLGKFGHFCQKNVPMDFTKWKHLTCMLSWD